MEVPLSQAYGLPAPLSGEPNETSPERGGEPSLDGGGVLCEIFCFMYQISRKHPSVSLWLPAPLKGSLYTKGEPDNKASPLGEGDRRQTVEGFLVESFA